MTTVGAALWRWTAKLPRLHATSRNLSIELAFHLPNSAPLRDRRTATLRDVRQRLPLQAK